MRSARAYWIQRSCRIQAMRSASHRSALALYAPCKCDARHSLVPNLDRIRFHFGRLAFRSSCGRIGTGEAGTFPAGASAENCSSRF